jgi:hypothetical protein
MSSFRIRFAGWLKDLDQFKSQVYLNIHKRNRNTGEKKHITHFGSKVGGVTTFCVQILLITFFVTSFVSTFEGKSDNIQKQKVPIFDHEHLDNGGHIIKMKDSNFLYSVNIIPMNDNTTDFSSDYGYNTFKSELDIAKMENYVIFALNIRTRTPESTLDYQVKFRPCKRKDFEINDIAYEEELFERLLKHRVCPDIDKSNPAYEVLNTYTNS